MRVAQPKPQHGGTASTTSPLVSDTLDLRAPQPAMPLWLERKVNAFRVVPPAKISSPLQFTYPTTADTPPRTRAPTPATASHFNISGSGTELQHCGDSDTEAEEDPCTSPVTADCPSAQFPFRATSDFPEDEFEDDDDDSLYLHKLALSSFHMRQLRTGLEVLAAEFDPAVDDAQRLEELRNLARWRADQKINVIGREVPEEVGGLVRPGSSAGLLWGCS